ncbi:3-dehydroquinate synthase [Aureispira anguillae]|uniref:3-dehydroquinate synthase n=1 Tax=Aureispira anguillae TaxID=2864201 RepID=A0A915YIU0_9BACT|nr:3-dehydroquinate synthase [Aureispira anguillae]BDS13883.1 3-dehydroquinate synthase [Aureispira anguillae]
MISLQGYNIQFQDQGFIQLKEQLRTGAYSKIFVLVDTNTEQYCLPILQKALMDYELNIISIEAGEAHKNIQTCQIIWTALMNQQADRKSVLLNLGGGVIGDMGGFCASTFKRGMDFIQIPTTLLAQVDASIGGKLGIDFALVKNSIGLFKNPKAVYLLSDFFDTLPQNELYSGFAEIVKHALIEDGRYFSQLLTSSNLANLVWEPIIAHSLSIKKKIVEQDPFEQNIRKSLNFGHTIGHAVESLSWETKLPLLHGEAVAIGMLTESYLSWKLTGLLETDLAQITTYLLRLYPSYDLTNLDPTAILALIRQDKKNEHNQICFTLLKEIGTFKINVHAEDELILEALNYYNQLTQGIKI